MIPAAQVWVTMLVSGMDFRKLGGIPG